MNEEKIVEIVENFVKSKCENDTSGHDFYHIKRVRDVAMMINKEENANEFKIKMIALMHDLYDHKFFDGDPVLKLEETLKELNVYENIKKEDIEDIINSCTNLGFSSNVSEHKELSKEGQIVQDADRLDGLGAIGIARTFIYSGKTGTPMYDPNESFEFDPEEYQRNGSKSSIHHFYDKILKLNDLLNTDGAKKVAENRHKFVEEFLNEFLDEWEGKR